MSSSIAQESTISTPIEGRGRASATQSPSTSRPTSRSSSRVRDFIHSISHQGAPQDWATQSFAHAHDPSSLGSRTTSPAPSRPASPSPAGSRSSSRVREVLHKVTHMGAPQDWASQSFVHAQDPSSVGVQVVGEERVGRAAAPATEGVRSSSRSGSRARDVLKKVTHMGAGTDWATQSFANASEAAKPVAVKEPTIVV